MNAAPDPPLVDQAVALRPWTEADVEELVRCCNDPGVRRFIPVIPIPYMPEDARAFVARTVTAGELNLAVTDRATGALLGAVGVALKPWDAGMAEIGYWLAPEARGRGAATRALRLLARWTLREWPIGRLHLMADVDNTASQAVAERAGFTREGVMRSGMLARGVARDHVVFSLLPGEA
ncbi:MAG: GNAT family N-acetyltransferase [Gaiellales bacterium]